MPKMTEKIQDADKLQTHKPICEYCNRKMNRIYVRDYKPSTTNHSRHYIGVGWICLECGNIIRD